MPKACAIRCQTGSQTQIKQPFHQRAHHTHHHASGDFTESMEIITESMVNVQLDTVPAKNTDKKPDLVDLRRCGW